MQVKKDMPRISSMEAADKWSRRLKGATQDIKMGVEATTQAPGESAAKAQDKLQANFQAAVSSGRWARATRAVTLEQWKKAMIEKGLSRVSAGVDSGKPKMEQFTSEFFPYLDRVESEVSAMPSLTLEDNINRATTAMRRIAEYRKTR